MDISLIKFQNGIASSYVGALAGSSNGWFSSDNKPTDIPEHLWNTVDTQSLTDGIYVVRYFKTRIVDLDLVCSIEHCQI
jgi:hypothetical protein